MYINEMNEIYKFEDRAKTLYHDIPENHNGITLVTDKKLTISINDDNIVLAELYISNEL